MKYFLDTEFIEGFRKPFFSKNRHFIDLISIGIVAEDGREFYAVSNEFDLEYIWKNKDTWVKENVLKPLHSELCKRVGNYGKTYHYHLFEPFTIKSMKNLIKWYGKTNREIATEVMEFTLDPKGEKFDSWLGYTDDFFKMLAKDKSELIEFYGYYSDYDWVVFCSLFGRMIDLPKGFPMYCRDLKQMMDERILDSEWKKVNCPDPENEHNALADAKWNKKLYEVVLNK